MVQTPNNKKALNMHLCRPLST